MPRRRRLFTPNKHKIKSVSKTEAKHDNDSREEVNTARGRFKGALKDVLEPVSQDDSDDSAEETPSKRDRRQSEDRREVYLSDEEAKKALRKSPPRQSYVLKLFDRSVDLSQFHDDSPLYPICRAWMANQPKANYRSTARSPGRGADWEGGVELPGPRGAPVGKVPPPARLPPPADKDNINHYYRGDARAAGASAPAPSREQLLRMLMPRWAAVKHAWQEHILRKEARYEGTQKVLNRINLEYPTR